MNRVALVPLLLLVVILCTIRCKQPQPQQHHQVNVRRSGGRIEFNVGLKEPDQVYVIVYPHDSERDRIPIAKASEEVKLQHSIAVEVSETEKYRYLVHLKSKGKNGQLQVVKSGVIDV